jgi:hypothetical protein
MRPLLALAAVALATAAAAAPAHAANPIGGLPDCATGLANAATGAQATCSTVGPGDVACRGCGVRRTIDVIVATGSVDYTRTCAGVTTAPVRVAAGTQYEDGLWGGVSCTVSLVAAADGTTAAVTSIASYVIIQD